MGITFSTAQNTGNRGKNNVGGVMSPNTGIQKTGFFRIIEWDGDRAYLESQDKLRILTHNNKDIYDVDQANSITHSYAKNVWDVPNVGNNGGLYTILNYAVTGTSPAAASIQNGVNLASNTINPFNTASSFLGVGNGLVSTTVANASSVGAGTNAVTFTSASGFTVGDVVLFTNSTTAQTLGSTTATGIISSISGTAITLAQGLSTTINTGTYIIRDGNYANNVLNTGSTVAYKGMDSSANSSPITYPVLGYSGTTATATWQVTYGPSDAAFTWNQCMIAAVTAGGTALNGGASTSAYTTPPTSYVCLAVTAWFPSPLSKGNATISQQYIFQLS